MTPAVWYYRTDHPETHDVWLWALLNGYEITDESADSDDTYRLNWDLMLEAVEESEVRTILISDLSVLSEHQDEAQEIIDELKEDGITVIVVADP